MNEPKLEPGKWAEQVYYFPEDGEPYDMVYQQSGMFENKFDEGFFDEASKQQFSVIKKAREIQHV